MRWIFFEAGCEERGHTLVEALVALALLLTVLVPVGGVCYRLATQRTAPLHSEALMLARSEMEQALRTRPLVTVERWTPEKRWRVRQTVTREQRVLTVRISVHRGASATPLVWLQTQRLAERGDSRSSKPLSE